jgi:CelD/BcsL family acetyltransferase involved in cellulose biosynthesis
VESEQVIEPERRPAPAMSRNQIVAGELFTGPDLRVSAVTDGLAFARLRQEWNELHEASGAGLFNSWEWLFSWWHRIGQDRAPWILTARDPNGRLEGLMALGLERRRVAGRVVRRLAFLGETHVGSDYLDVIARSGNEEAIARAFGLAIRAAAPSWDVLDLLDLHDDSVTLLALRDAFAPGEFDERVTERYLCPFETFEAGETFDAFLRRTGRRDNYLRRRKWLEKQDGFRITCARTPEALARPMAEFQRLHSLRWLSDGGSQGIKGPSVEAFHRDATQWLAERGKVRIYTLELGGRALASVYGLVHGDEFIYFQSGYDPEWRSKSVGLVLVGETFRDAIESGLRGYDFLRGTETYKSDWTSKQRRTVALRIHAHDGRGAWLTRYEELAKSTRDFAKRLMPHEWVERVRRARRARAHI